MLLKKVSTETPKVISPRDPRSAWTAKANKRVQFGYSLNYMIDTETSVIVDVEATPARTYDEVTASKTMLDRTEEHLGLKPERPCCRHGLRHRQVFSPGSSAGVSRRIFRSGT
jgi:hypothetical protein